MLELDNKNKDFGIYQIYGRHIIFGADSLLYIGETNQTFSQRFAEHTGWLEEEGGSIHVGRIVSEDYDAYNRKKVIKDTEALTINWHSPPYNSSNIDTYNGQRLKVVNLGERGSLEEEYISSNQ